MTPRPFLFYSFLISCFAFAVGPLVSLCSRTIAVRSGYGCQVLLARCNKLPRRSAAECDLSERRGRESSPHRPRHASLMCNCGALGSGSSRSSRAAACGIWSRAWEPPLEPTRENDGPASLYPTDDETCALLVFPSCVISCSS